MAHFKFLQELEILRERINAPECMVPFDQPLSEFQKIERELRTKGIVVKPEDIQRIGPYLVYKENHLAILYIQNSKSSREELESNRPYSNTPKFHLTWCTAVDRMYRNKRFERFVLSQAESNLFRVESGEDEFGERHMLDNIRLFPCKYCLGELRYRGYVHEKLSREQRDRHVETFQIKDFLAENYGTLVSWKILPKNHARYSRTGGYSSNFAEISRRIRRKYNWTCTKCGVRMTDMKEGLHTHHVNGVQNDDRLENLQVLCALCHKHVDKFHAHMEIRPDIEDYILKHRSIDTPY